MNNSNSNIIEGVGVFVSTREDEFAAFDALPASLRAEIRESNVTWSAVEVADMLPEHDAESLAQHIRRADLALTGRRINEHGSPLSRLGKSRNVSAGRRAPRWL